MIIIDYISDQLSIALKDFDIDLDHSEFYLICKYKRVLLEDRKY